MHEQNVNRKNYGDCKFSAAAKESEKEASKIAACREQHLNTLKNEEKLMFKSFFLISATAQKSRCLKLQLAGNGIRKHLKKTTQFNKIIDKGK